MEISSVSGVAVVNVGGAIEEFSDALPGSDFTSGANGGRGNCLRPAMINGWSLLYSCEKVHGAAVVSPS